MINTFRIAACVVVVITLFGCENKRSHFKKISSSHSGIHFNNEIKETDSINIFDFSNVYNGGGVGVADFILQEILLRINYTSIKVISNSMMLQKDQEPKVKANGAVVLQLLISIAMEDLIFMYRPR